MEHAISWYKYACKLVSDDYLKEPLIMKTLLVVMERIVTIASRNSQWKEEESYYKEQIQKIKKRKETSAYESYDVLIKKQELDTVKLIEENDG